MLKIMPYERKNYDPFEMFREFDKNFFNFPSQFGSMKTDIKDDGENYTLEAELPGFEKEDIKLDIDNNYLILTAEHSKSSEEKDNGGKYIRRERSYGSYQRSFDISDVVHEKIGAEYQNGILKVTLPKKSTEEYKTKSVEIK